MIDFHTHVLPGMDDGSCSTEESDAMLKTLAKQGVTTVVATPHYVAQRETVDRFLTRRQAAFDRLMQESDPSWPTVVLGAEVRYYSGISTMARLGDLCAGDSRTLLLEMPSTRWTASVVREVANLSYAADLTVVLAHIERYLRHQPAAVWDILRQNGVCMQLSCSALSGFFSRRKALRLLDAGAVQVLGTDCHDTALRPPNMDVAVRAISAALGEDGLQAVSSFSESLLSVSKQTPQSIEKG